MFRFRKRSNRIGIYKPADEGAINVRDVETAFNKSSSKSSSSSSKSGKSGSKNEGSISAPVNWNVDVGLHGLTSIKNRRVLADVITHNFPTPTKGIFNKGLIDYLLYYKLLDNEKELIKYISEITVIYLNMELTPQIIKLLRLTIKYSLHIHTIVLINITLTLKIIKIFRVNEFLGIKNLMVSNIKLPNDDDKEVIIDELIKMIKKMTNIEVLDFSGFKIYNIYKNCPSRTHTVRYKFAKLFNNLILKLVNLQILNFTYNTMNKTEYDMIFETHTINNITFEYWDNEYATDTFIKIFKDGKNGMYRRIDINASPNFIVDMDNDVLIATHINLNVNVKIKIEEHFIENVAIKGGHKLRKKKPAKPTKKKIITKN
jgi:hypothetical protein